MAFADTQKLVVEIDLKGNLKQGIAQAKRDLQGLDKVASRAGQGVKTAAGNLATLGKIGGGLVVAGLAASVVEASNLNEQLSKSAVVFGEASAEVIAFSKTTAASLGLAQSSALEAAGAFGNMFKTTGIADEAAADMSTTMVTLAADMASFNNEDPSEMLDRLRSGLSGEAEPLRRFGVLLSEAAVQQEAYATGIAKTGEKLTEAQKVQARYSLILKQTKVQQGDFERTSGSLANQMRILRASFQDSGAVIGTALLPQVTKIATKLNELIKTNQPAIEAFAQKLPGAFDKFIGVAERVPWATIGSGLEKAAFFAEKLFDAFLGLPPEVQTTLIALAGLNKLSGGAITGIVGELGKGLIKGVLGINAGVVNINAATVNGGPGAPGGGGGIGVKGVLAATGAAAVALAVQEGAKQGILAATGSREAAAAQAATGGGPTNLLGPIDRLVRALSGDFRSELEVQQDLERQQVDVLTAQRQADALNAQSLVRAADRADQQRREQTAKLTAHLAPIRSEMIGVRQAQTAALARLDAQKAAIERVHAAERATAETVRAKDFSPTVQVAVDIRNIVSAQNKVKTIYRTQS